MNKAKNVIEYKGLSLNSSLQDSLKPPQIETDTLPA